MFARRVQKLYRIWLRGAVKDDVKGTVRQIVKSGEEKQFRNDATAAMRGAKVKTVKTNQGGSASWHAQ